MAERDRFVANPVADADRSAHLITRLPDDARADMAEGAPGAVTDLAAPLARLADAHQDGSFAIELILLPSFPSIALPEPAVEMIVSILA